jgi:hypothetical protein
VEWTNLVIQEINGKMVMFGIFRKKNEDTERVRPNGHYEGEILSGDYAAGAEDYHDIWPHGQGKLTVTLDDGTVETYEGSWHVGKFHGSGKLSILKSDGEVKTIEGEWVLGERED